MRLRMYLLLLFVLLAITSCSTAPEPQIPDAKQPPIPTSEPGSSTVVGQIIGTTTKAPIKLTPVYLAAISWDQDHKEAAFILNISNSPAAQTDENGFFVMPKVQPAEYAIVVGDFYGRNEVLRESNGNAHIFVPKAGQVLDVGKIEMPPDVQK